MTISLKNKLFSQSLSRDLVALAFLNGISGMALNGAAIFGMLAILSGRVFLHGLVGLGFYVLGSAFGYLHRLCRRVPLWRPNGAQIPCHAVYCFYRSCA